MKKMHWSVICILMFFVVVGNLIALYSYPSLFFSILKGENNNDIVYFLHLLSKKPHLYTQQRELFEETIQGTVTHALAQQQAQFEKQYNTLQELLKYNNKSKDVYIALSRLCTQHNRHDLARYYIKIAYQIDPLNTQTLD